MSKESDAMCNALSGIADRWLKGDRRHRVLSEQQKESREWDKLAKKIEGRKKGTYVTCSNCGAENWKKYFVGDLCAKCTEAATEKETI